MMTEVRPRHIDDLERNVEEVLRLVEIHAHLTGSAPGRRYNVAILNKAGIVLVVSCWEAFVEDLASHGFEWLLKNAATPAVFPRAVLALASKELRQAADVTRVWELADTGWRQVMQRHKDELLRKSVGRLNTPRQKQVDQLFADLLGIAVFSRSWRWHNVPNDKVKAMLDDLVTLRGEIAHRVVSSRPVTKRNVQEAARLILRLAEISSNTVRKFLMTRVATTEEPWVDVKFEGL